MTVGSPGLVAQSVQTAALVTLHPLVSDGARYAVMAAQLSHRKIIAPPVFDKAKALFPHIALFPGHRLPVCPKVFTMCPVHFVQYVPGIYRPWSRSPTCYAVQNRASLAWNHTGPPTGRRRYIAPD